MIFKIIKIKETTLTILFKFVNFLRETILFVLCDFIDH